MKEGFLGPLYEP